MITVGSLFAGIGGIELGLERTNGFKTVWQVENDPYAVRVLEKHWPDVRRWGDVETFPPDASEQRGDGGESSERQGEAGRGEAIQEQTRGGRGEWACDLICGGFPCQDISYAGKGAGLDGSRSGLWYEFARVIRVLRPRIVLVENVQALLTRGISDVLGTLASLGYDAEWDCIPAAAVGAPHIRDRVFVVAYARGIDGNIREAGGYQDSKQAVGCKVSRWEAMPMDAANGGKMGWQTDTGNWWATEPDVGRVAHGISHRVDRLRCLGNAVVPQVAEYVGYRILKHEREKV